MLIDQLPHQFRNPDGRMRIVQLDAVHFMKALDGQSAADALAQHVLDRAGDEEILLLQAQTLAFQLLVVGVEDLGDRFRGDFLLDRAVIVPAVEIGEVKGLRGLRTPQAKQRAGIDAVTRDGRIIRYTNHYPRRHPLDPITALLILIRLGMPAQFDHLRELRPGNLPDVAEAQPFVGYFDLPAVLDDLVENAEFVANAVAESGITQGGQRIQVAGGQPTESAVPESRLLLQPD